MVFWTKLASMFLRAAVVAVSILLSCVAAPAQVESIFSETNAYNPIPNPSGSMVAYVRTGWGRHEGFMSLGRSNLISVTEFVDSKGHPVSRPPIDGFADRWVSESTLGCFRDWKFGLATEEGWKEGGAIPGDFATGPPKAERATYLKTLKTFVWLEYVQSKTESRTVLQSPGGPIAEFETELRTSDLIIPSPDERYIAFADIEIPNLSIFDVASKKLVDLGPIRIYPTIGEWDYIKPSWDPWFRDSSMLTFAAGDGLYVASPDGERRERVGDTVIASLPVPSPDGRFIAYVTYTGRPRKGRPDLTFWGGATLWVVGREDQKRERVTVPTEDTTFGLRWLNASTLIFDRISDNTFYRHARIWTATVPQH